jgi:hypothetical protein
MAYIVNKTNGNIVAVVEDGTVDSTSSSINLVGKSTLNYGEYIAENEIFMLENFALETPPANPLVGQLWYDTTVNKIKAYDGDTWESPVTTQYYSTVTNTTGTGTITVQNDSGITVGENSTVSMKFDNGSAVIQTNDTENALSINPADGMVTVLSDPTNDLGIATKGYVDSKVSLDYDLDNAISIGSDTFTATVGGAETITSTPASGTLTGIWYVTNSPEPAVSDNQIATTQFVQDNKESPVFTGTPTAPTATADTNTDQLATTAFVQDNKESPVFTGVPAAPTAVINTNTDQIATTAFVKTRSDADKVSPEFTGTPSAPTAPLGTSTTQLSTTAFVQNALSDFANTMQTIYAPIISPDFVGTPTAPTASVGNSSNQLATTEYVMVATERWGGSRKFVSESDPTDSQGDNGDFWFKIL